MIRVVETESLASLLYSVSMGALPAVVIAESLASLVTPLNNAYPTSRWFRNGVY
jgi:hypothetical protein